MENFYSSKTSLKMAGGGMHTQHTPHPPGSAFGCIITKDGLKFKRYVLNKKYRWWFRHDCCREVKENNLLSGGTGKTIFKC